MENQENQMNIELSEDIALGVYSNLAIITHSPAEVVCDFVQIMPGMPKGKVRSRVLMTPQNAKRFLQAKFWRNRRTSIRFSSNEFRNAKHYGLVFYVDAQRLHPHI
jgi:hypothetical protein